MLEVFLTYPTPEGSREIALDADRISMGRGSDADLRFDDDGLSRLHATIHRDGEKIWILDENSTNGTFVNGEKVPPAGTSLDDGDRVKIGHYTDLRIRFEREKPAAPATENKPAQARCRFDKSVQPARNFARRADRAGDFHNRGFGGVYRHSSAWRKRAANCSKHQSEPADYRRQRR